MAAFYFNHDLEESSESQWTRHIQNQAYVEEVTKSISNSSANQTRDFSSIIAKQSIEISDTIHSASIEQVAAIQQSTNVICGTLESGFGLLSDDLQEISFGIYDLRSELNAMASMLDWKLSLLIEHQKITNLLLGNIAVLLRIPDIQKERQYHIEQGIKFLKNAIFDNDFYDDSLSNLLKAEKIEPTDFFALHRIGLIYMYSPKHLALSKAEEYFKKAAKYAVAESNTGASVSINFLAGDVNGNLSEQIPTVDTIKLQAAESYLFAGRSCYIQGKLNEAADLAGKGFKLVPELAEAGFMQAKALAANNNETDAAIVLEKVINTDRFYSLKTLSDLDLIPKNDIKILLKKLQKEATEEATTTLQNCKQKMISGSNATVLIAKIERLINKNTYLTSKKAIDLQNNRYSYTFNEAIEKDNYGKWIAIIKSMTFCFSIDELINYEILLADKLIIVKELIQKKESKDKLHFQANDVSLILEKTSNKLLEKNKDKDDTSKFALGGLISFIIGCIILSQGMHSFLSALIWLLGLALCAAGLFFGVGTFIQLLGQSVSSSSLSSKSNAIKAEKESLDKKIKNIEKDIKHLEIS